VDDGGLAARWPLVRVKGIDSTSRKAVSLRSMLGGADVRSAAFPSSPAPDCAKFRLLPDENDETLVGQKTSARTTRRPSL
jgi:hypothetical protein